MSLLKDIKQIFNKNLKGSFNFGKAVSYVLLRPQCMSKWLAGATNTYQQLILTTGSRHYWLRARLVCVHSAISPAVVGAVVSSA